MLLVLVRTLLRPVPVAVNSVSCAVEAVNCDRKLERVSSPAASQGGGSRVGAGAAWFVCARGGLPVLPERTAGVAFGRLLESVRDAEPR